MGKVPYHRLSRLSSFTIVSDSSITMIPVGCTPAKPASWSLLLQAPNFLNKKTATRAVLYNKVYTD